MTNTERKLATIRRIAKIEPIEGADKIVKATVDGWQLVTAKDNGFKEGDLVTYFEIDSWIPTELASFLSKGKEPREFNGVKGERLKTIKLRGQVSQGLIMSLGHDSTWQGNKEFYFIMSCDRKVPVHEGDDVTELLNIQKWEKPIPAQLAGQCRGNFPSFLRKTDQERAQNLVKEIEDSFYVNELFEITEKLDGSSMTVYYNEFEQDNNGPVDIRVGVCSRNLDLKLDQEGNAFVDMAKNSGLLDALVNLRRNIAVQGELCGPGIQGNNEGLSAPQFYVFDIFDIDEYRYLSPAERWDVFDDLVREGFKGSHVPVIVDAGTLISANVVDLLAAAEGKNAVGKEREGLVFKSHESDFSFKCISNKFLLGNDE